MPRAPFPPRIPLSEVPCFGKASSTPLPAKLDSAGNMAQRTVAFRAARLSSRISRKGREFLPVQQDVLTDCRSRSPLEEQPDQISSLCLPKFLGHLVHCSALPSRFLRPVGGRGVSGSSVPDCYVASGLKPLWRPHRGLSSSSSPVSEEELRSEVDTINEKFAEARDEIEMALESMDTVYFNEEAETARAAVQAVLDRFKVLLHRLDDERRGSLQRSMGLKMEQLKGELEQLKHDHE